METEIMPEKFLIEENSCKGSLYLVISQVMSEILAHILCVLCSLYLVSSPYLFSFLSLLGFITYKGKWEQHYY